MRSSVIFVVLVAVAACKGISVEVKDNKGVKELLVDVPAKESVRHAAKTASSEPSAEGEIEGAVKSSKPDVAKALDTPDVPQLKSVVEKLSETKDHIDGAQDSVQEAIARASATLDESVNTKTLTPLDTPQAEDSASKVPQNARQAPESASEAQESASQVSTGATEELKAEADASEVISSPPTKSTKGSVSSGDVQVEAQPGGALKREKRDDRSIYYDSYYYNPYYYPYYYEQDQTSQLLNGIYSLISQSQYCNNNNHGCGCGYYGCGYYGCGWPYRSLGGKSIDSNRELPGTPEDGQDITNPGRSFNPASSIRNGQLWTGDQVPPQQQIARSVRNQQPFGARQNNVRNGPSNLIGNPDTFARNGRNYGPGRSGPGRNVYDRNGPINVPDAYGHVSYNRQIPQGGPHGYVDPQPMYIPRALDLTTEAPVSSTTRVA